MSKEEKDAQIIDLNLFSGSSDTMRANLGGIFEIVNVDEVSELTLSPFFGGGVYETTIRSGEGSEWKEFDDLNLVNLFFDRTYRSGPEDDPHTPAVPVSDDTVIPTFKFPIRLYGKEDQITNSNQWEIILMGGTYGDIPYPTIYNESVWDDYWFETGFPYTKQEVNSLVDGSTVTSISQITYDYNHYLREYQDYASTLNSELLIPNMYLVEMFNLPSDIAILYIDTALTEDVDFLSETVTPTGRVFDQTMRDFVSLEGTTSDLDVLLSDVDVVWVPAPTFLIGPDDAEGAVTAWEGISDHKLHGYLSQSVPLTYLSASTRADTENMLQNIYFDQYSIWHGTPKNTFDDMENTKSLFPYYININFPKFDVAVDPLSGDVEASVPFGISLINNNFSSKFLKSLKEVFNNETYSLVPEEKEYVLSLEYQSASIDSDTDSTMSTLQNTPFRTVNYFDLLTYAYENYISTTDNEYFVGEKTIHREAAIDKTATYRYINSESVLGVIEDAIEYVSNTDNFNVDSLSDLYNFPSKHNEILAYRIEKIGGPPTGDAQTQNVLQNYWIINSIISETSTTMKDRIEFFDSQVKYNQDYTYNIYAYILSVGVKYQTSDLRLTRVINEIRDPDTDEFVSWCVEFYDPDTGLAADPLLGTPTEEETEEEEIADLPPSVITIFAEDIPATPYLADFYVNVEPSLQVFEVPIDSKTLKVLDNPTNQLGLKPFQLVDASQTIGYDVEYETFAEEIYPGTISSADETLKIEYLNARDLLGSDFLPYESVSQQRYVEVYRISEMPSGFEDFDNNLVSTIDLKIKDSSFTLPNTIFYDMIKTNQKYYYIFRVLNENLIPGHLSEIYEAELIDDGGYVYSNFDLFFEEDLSEDIFVNPSIPFKKLIQLQANMSQIVFNDSIVNYEAPAHEQLNNMGLGSADDLIWDKTFKIRLTSKKTGKKIDLNVTYKYETDSN